MGQCGCGETNPERGFKLPSGAVVAYDIYRGCDGCFRGPAVSVYVYNNGKSEWLRHAKVEPYKPDEYGGNHGHGICFGLFEVSDLRAEAVELTKEGSIGRRQDQYASLDDWLEDYGLRLIQGAMRRFSKRDEEMEAERNKAKE